MLIPNLERFGHIGRERYGVTLVETVIALMIFGIFIAGMCRLVLASREANDRARAHYTAVNLGKNRVERMKVSSFGELEQFAESRVVVNASGNPDPNGDYRRTTNIRTIGPTLKEVAVVVEIRDKVSRAFTVGETVQTYIADFRLPTP